MIYFMLPDTAVSKGGIRHAYDLVDGLASLGHEATVWHGKPGFRCDWFANDTPVVNSRELRLDVGDIMVVPEVGGRSHSPLVAEARVVMNVQNHFYIFSSASPQDEWEGAYPGWPNAVTLLVSSRAINDFVNMATTAPLPTFLINYDVGEIFRPSVKQRVVAYMPRKRSGEIAATVQLLKCSASMRDWEFDEIDNADQEDVAARLGRAAIFLAGSDREGFGLPPAEAMASGCYVIGFNGNGGREFMLEDHCSVIEDQNLVAFATEVERIAQLWDLDRESIERRTERAREFVRSRYNRGNLVAALGEAFDEITAPDSPARQPHPVTVYHYASQRRTRSVKEIIWRCLPTVITDAWTNRGASARS
jgi:hypothetical protein